MGDVNLATEQQKMATEGTSPVNGHRLGCVNRSGLRPTGSCTLANGCALTVNTKDQAFVQKSQQESKMFQVCCHENSSLEQVSF